MLIAGENLSKLVEQFSICPTDAYDQFSISLRLDAIYFAPKVENTSKIVYNKDNVEGRFEKKKISRSGLTLAPSQAVLGCSAERISMPVGYFGLLQTKGTLARIFCTVHVCDGQVEPGFSGKITFEIVNLGPFHVNISTNDNIAQLFVFSCSTNSTPIYSGRYNGADGPTLMRPML